MQTKQAVILAGGLGTRLKPLTEKVPKPLVEVHGRPFLCWLLDYLKGQKIEEVLILLSYLGEKIEAYFNENPVPGLRLSYSSEPYQMGTGGAVKNAEAKLQAKFWLLNGDTFVDLDLAAIEQFCINNTFANAMVCFNNPSSLGVKANVVVKNNQVLKYIKDETNKDASSKNDSGKEVLPYVDSGVYLIDRQIVTEHPDGKFQLDDLLLNPIAQNQVGAFTSTTPFYDMGTIERLNSFPKAVIIK